MKAQRTLNMKPNYYSIKGSKLNPWRQENSKQGFRDKNSFSFMPHCMSACAWPLPQTCRREQRLQNHAADDFLGPLDQRRN